LRRIVITGATGLIGSHLLPLLSPEDEVHCLGRRSPEQGSTAARLVHHYADLAAAFPTDGLPGEIDGVICLAQSQNFRAFPEHALDVFDVNVGSVLRLLDYARRAGARSFVSASSGGIYGSATDPVSEEAWIEASGKIGFYLSTKLCGEIVAENFSAYMNVAMLRFFFCYGAGQRRSMLMPRLVDNVRDGTPVTLQGPDGIRINPLHATDAATACLAALAMEGSHRINVAGPEVLSLRDICQLIGKKVGRTPRFNVQDGVANAGLVADTNLMARLIGAPQRRVAEHIAELL
jgi:nucleoside-diphosphate-sugar epimerase